MGGGQKMIHEKHVEEWKNKDVSAYLDCYHEDWQITFHSTGKVMRLADLADQIGNWVVTGNFEQHRCIHENDDILVTHNITTLGNGSREAVLQSISKKDVLLWRGGTGATPLPRNE